MSDPSATCLLRSYVQNNKLASLAKLKQVPTLTTLDAASNRLRSLDGVQRCPGLVTLHAGGNGFDGVAAVAAVAGCTALTTLDLQDNSIGDAAGLLELLKVTSSPDGSTHGVSTSGFTKRPHVAVSLPQLSPIVT